MLLLAPLSMIFIVKKVKCLIKKLVYKFSILTVKDLSFYKKREGEGRDGRDCRFESDHFNHFYTRSETHL